MTKYIFVNIYLQIWNRNKYRLHKNFAKKDKGITFYSLAQVAVFFISVSNAFLAVSRAP